MGVVVRRYVDIPIIIITFARKLRYYGNVIHSFYWKSAVKHDGGV